MVLMMVLLLAGWTSAAPLTIMTSEEPPLNFTDKQGTITGISVDVAHEIQQRVGNADPIRTYPWARVYKTIVVKPNVVAFTMARTEEREEKFHWITLVNRNAWMLLGKKGSRIQISNLEDAKRVKAIGVVRDSAREKLLLSLGFQNIESVPKNVYNIRKLLANRLSLVFYTVSGTLKACRDIGVDFENELEVVYPVKMSGAYIVMSKNTPISTVEKWQQAAQQMKTDGTFDRIMHKWQDYMYTHDGLETHLLNGGLNLWKTK